MWSFASSCIAGHNGLRSGYLKLNQGGSECSDDEASSIVSREEGLECPICCESFNIVENVPYVLWCGHTLCKNCILGLQWAVLKFPTSPVQLPLFISCPWCNCLSFRLVYNGSLRFPRKNYFLLWMVESMNGDRGKLHPNCSDSHSKHAMETQVNCGNRRQGQPINHAELPRSNLNHGGVASHLNVERLHSSIKKFLVFFVHMTSKFPLVIILILILLYAIPASAAILLVYMLVTVLFALPSLLMLYFSYPSLDWLMREIIT